MNTENTRKRFKERIAFERKIISIVNNGLRIVDPLNGLSQSAINLWKEKNGNFDYISQIYIMLNELSKSLMIFCDTSKTAFDQEKEIDSKFLKEKIGDLQRTVNLKNRIAN
ncbi:MAG: hypothetical protein JO154_06945 [Chitinophaga sp.]|uniref:hypothetical protein n=1 Tax=Chitinophaga sp. TaxID=1869181 RepID=UPI0025BFB660|nr:hypothetical protein [Chitinophaga sp.]MBV8252328.1 hypothetical protein [Chitinophaga sp.]